LTGGRIADIFTFECILNNFWRKIMLKKKEEKIASTVHLYRRQIQQIDRLVEQTGHSRARVLREIVDVGLTALTGKGAEGQQARSPFQKEALDRLLRMSDGYGGSLGSGLDRLDEELYDHP
jgi:hypothetical protein